MRSARTAGATVARTPTNNSTTATAKKFIGSAGRTSGIKNAASGRTRKMANAVPAPRQRDRDRISEQSRVGENVELDRQWQLESGRSKSEKL
jgi:hypothetical protein